MKKPIRLIASAAIAALLLSGCANSATPAGPRLADYDVEMMGTTLEVLESNGAIPLSQMNSFQRYTVECVSAAYPEFGGNIIPTQADGIMMIAEADLSAVSDKLDQCEEEGEALIKPTEEQKAELYQLEAANAECLRSEGQEITGIPTEQNYKDNWSRRGAWTAIEQVQQRTLLGEPPYTDEQYALLEELYLKCPPPSWSYQINN